ncbi:MAG: hypothetical protein PHV40_02720 [Candidatus Omnitrophica bacterium]|nr:hypothetical protein [Candidatus Omnitrophota bacterium]
MRNGEFEKIIVSLAACIAIFLVPAFAADKKIGPPDPVEVMREAQRMAVLDSLNASGQLPVEESGNDGYWWNRQKAKEKLAYVKRLIKEFKLENKKISAKKVVRALDIEYNPRDNPLDIKMDKSVEKIFSVVIGEMGVQ